MTGQQCGRVMFVDWPCGLLHIGHAEQGERVYHFADVDIPREDALQPGDDVMFAVAEVDAPYPWAVDIVRIPE